VEVERERALEGSFLHYFPGSDPDMDRSSQVARGVHTTATYCRLIHSAKRKFQNPVLFEFILQQKQVAWHLWKIFFE
jgi:hypothetical protein